MTTERQRSESNRGPQKQKLLSTYSLAHAVHYPASAVHIWIGHKTSWCWPGECFWIVGLARDKLIGLERSGVCASVAINYGQTTALSFHLATTINDSAVSYDGLTLFYRARHYPALTNPSVSILGLPSPRAPAHRGDALKRVAQEPGDHRFSHHRHSAAAHSCLPVCERPLHPSPTRSPAIGAPYELWGVESGEDSPCNSLAPSLRG
jgi:hypothetical protein